MSEKMKIELHEILVRDLVDGYADNDEEGVTGYGGRLDIRPKYQREFIYKEKQRDAVMDTVRNGFPLNVMYWAVREDGSFEVMDGQQRTISICQYVTDQYSIMYGKYPKKFSNLTKEEQDRILNYKLTIYFCEGNEEEKLKWFETVNIAGERLTDQELLNAVYSGPFVADAKKFFSKTNCLAYKIGEKYMAGTPIRQDYLATALSWISKGKAQDYMKEHQHDPNANALRQYYESVISWAKLTFKTYRKEMKGIDWGTLYDDFHNELIDTAKMEERIAVLMMDDDVTAKKGIYPYVLTGDEKYLNIRAFSPAMKRAAFEKQKGICKKCKKPFTLDEMEADHIKPWSEGGKTNAENCQMLCRDCNRRKSNK